MVDVTDSSFAESSSLFAGFPYVLQSASSSSDEEEYNTIRFRTVV